MLGIPAQSNELRAVAVDDNAASDPAVATRRLDLMHAGRAATDVPVEDLPLKSLEQPV
jgi:hypothetical protein